MPAETQAELAEEPYTIFDRRQVGVIVLIVSVAATFSAIASNIYFPALPTIAADLGVSQELVNLTVTSYLIFQGLAPSLWGPISDVRGRRVAYCCTFVVFLGACIGLANTRNYATLLVLRCLQSTGSASTIAIGSGVIGDITTRADRGGYMGIFQAGLLTPVAVGPIIGGALSGSLGWRSVFWFLTIYSGAFLVVLVLFCPETLRSIVGNGSRKVSSPIARYPLSLYQKTSKVKWTPELSAETTAPKKHIDVTRPLRILCKKHVAPILIFVAIYYAVWQMGVTAMSSLFKSRYGLSETQIGLTFIANGAGSMLGTFVSGKIMDRDYAKVKAKHQARIVQQAEAGNDTALLDFPLETARLRLLPLFAGIQALSILLFGWTVQYPNKVPIAIPIISTFFTGWTAVSSQSVATTYLVDIYSHESAAAAAALNFARCLCAAGGTTFITPLIDRIGAGPAFTVCVGIQAAGLIGVVIQWKFAAGWRQEAERQLEKSDDV